MNNKEFIIMLSLRSGFSQADTQRLVNTLVDEMANLFSEGDVLAIPFFGTFEVKKRMERIVVNPLSGKRMLVPPKLVLGFKPTTFVKEQLKNGVIGNE